MAARRAIALLVFLVSVASVLSVVSVRTAWADGAFPASLQILLPSDRASEIGLATNFGLILSEDGGATWQWTCEQPETFGATGYAVGPAPKDRFYALSMTQGLLAFSDDTSCTWTVSGGAIAKVAVSDYFADPIDASRVLVLGTPVSGASLAQVFASNDSGATFGPALYTAPPTGALRGVEIASSDPLTMYVALYTTTQLAVDGGIINQSHPKLVRSTDGGTTFTTIDLEATLGRVQFGIMAVDPTNARTLYLRVMDAEQNQESVAVSTDGGATFTTPVTVPGGVLTAFARLVSGTLLVGGTAGTTGLGFRSGDGGASFQPWTGVPHIQALAERAGKLYVAAKNYTDGWALGVSTDEGLTITPITTYDQVAAMKTCVQTLPVCMDSCEMVASRQIWSPAVCGDNVGTPPPAKSGCGCAVPGPRRAGTMALALGAAALLAAHARRRSRRP